MKVFDLEQYSPEWWRVRRGMPTASEAGRVVTSQGKASTGQHKYAVQLAKDCWRADYGQVEAYESAAMRNGHVMEPHALRMYERETGLRVERVGFATDDDGRFGASPDGMVSPTHGVEAKAPTAEVHLHYLYDKKVPTEYVPQVQWSLAATGAERWDFVSFHPDFEPLIVETYRDELTEKFLACMVKFHERLDALKSKMVCPQRYADEADEVLIF